MARRVKLPRRTFLHLAAGAAALPAVSRFAWASAAPLPHNAGGRQRERSRMLTRQIVAQHLGGPAAWVARRAEFRDHYARARVHVMVRALAWLGKGDIRCEEVPDPKIEDGRDAVIK
jgi:hypothetical protein